MQRKSMRNSWICLLVVSFFLGGCTTPVLRKSAAPLAEINCVAVIPVTPELQKNFSTQRKNEVEQGSIYANRVMSSLLAINPKARLFSEDDAMSIDASANKGRLGRLRAIGEKTDCQAVLLTSMQRFQQRQGGGMAVESPASAAFGMTLIQVPSGAVLWGGDYEETQQSFLANVFSGKMGQRGFRWVTVEELVRQALAERLAECPYLK